MSSGVVYGLFDPRTQLCHYVGSTTRMLIQRFAEHLGTSGKGAKHEWLDELRRRGLHVQVKVLEIVDGTDIGAAEQFWVQHLLWLGMPLTNKLLVSRKLAQPRRTFTIQATDILGFTVPPGTQVSGYQERKPGYALTEIQAAWFDATSEERQAIVTYVREDLAKKGLETHELFPPEA